MWFNLTEQWRNIQFEQPAIGQHCLVLIGEAIEHATWDGGSFFQMVDGGIVELPHVKWWMPVDDDGSTN